MKKFRSFLSLLLLLVIFIALFSFIYYMRYEKIPPEWIFFNILKNILYYLPVISSLSLLWPIVFRERSEFSYRGTEKPPNFKITVFLLFVTAGAFILQELTVPWMYNSISYSEMLKSRGITLKTPLKDTTGENFSMTEFNSLNTMMVKDNIAFSTGNAYFYFNRMYDGKGAYYVEGFRFLSFNSKKEIEYVITSDYAKIFSDLIYVVNPLFFDYSRTGNIAAKRIGGIKKIVLPYRPAGIFALSSDTIPDTVSLADVFLYSDFAFNSGINFYRLGNIVFNRIAYYIILVLMMILASTFGSAFKNIRTLSREYLQTAAFYAVSFFLLTILYDSLAKAVNMIYSLLL